MKPFALLGAVFVLGAAGGDCRLLKLLCGDDPVPSVRLKIVNEAGQTLPIAEISARLNLGVPVEFACNGDCEDVIPAFDAVGRFDFSIAAPGYQALDRTVFVENDVAGCHPATQAQTIVLPIDTTVGALRGAWRTVDIYGETVIRFGESGEAIGAILFDRQIAGDGNFYIAYNSREIRGALDQPIAFVASSDPVRTNERFEFATTTLSFPVGFSDALMADEFMTLTGTLAGLPVVYTRLNEIPEPLRDP